MRYAHGERYLRELGERHGFAVLEVLQHVLREDQGRPIDGLYLYLRARLRRDGAIARSGAEALRRRQRARR
jgi:hypothetical protein